MDIPYYERLLNSVPALADYPVSLTSKKLRLKFNEPNTIEVWAIHINCDATKRSSTNLTLKKLYNRGRPQDLGSLPDGKVFKYVQYFGYQRDQIPLNFHEYC